MKIFMNMIKPKIYLKKNEIIYICNLYKGFSYIIIYEI